MAASNLEARKSPQQGRGRATVEAILEAAAHILEQRGLEGFNTNAVAQRAGVSIGSLYQYFPNKDALIAALSRQHAAQFLEAFDHAARDAADQDLDANIVALARVAVAQQLSRPKLTRILDEEDARPPLRNHERRTIVAIRERVESALRRSVVSLPSKVAGTLAGDLLFIARGLIDGAAMFDAPDEGEMLERVVAALRGYLKERGVSMPLG